MTTADRLGLPEARAACRCPDCLEEANRHPHVPWLWLYLAAMGIVLIVLKWVLWQ